MIPFFIFLGPALRVLTTENRDNMDQVPKNDKNKIETYLNHVAENEVRYKPGWLVHGKVESRPGFLYFLRQQQLGNAPDIAAGAQRLVVCLSLQQVGAGYHHLVHPARPQRSCQMICHEPAIARTNHQHRPIVETHML